MGVSKGVQGGTTFPTFHSFYPRLGHLANCKLQNENFKFEIKNLQFSFDSTLLEKGGRKDFKGMNPANM
jgi:hypothetical protein